MVTQLVGMSTTTLQRSGSLPMLLVVLFQIGPNTSLPLFKASRAMLCKHLPPSVVDRTHLLDAAEALLLVFAKHFILVADSTSVRHPSAYDRDISFLQRLGA